MPVILLLGPKQFRIAPIQISVHLQSTLCGASYMPCTRLYCTAWYSDSERRDQTKLRWYHMKADGRDRDQLLSDCRNSGLTFSAIVVRNGTVRLLVYIWVGCCWHHVYFPTTCVAMIQYTQLPWRLSTQYLHNYLGNLVVSVKSNLFYTPGRQQILFQCPASASAS